MLSSTCAAIIIIFMLVFQNYFNIITSGPHTSGALTALVYALDRDTLRRLNWSTIKVGTMYMKEYICILCFFE